MHRCVQAESAQVRNDADLKAFRASLDGPARTVVLTQITISGSRGAPQARQARSRNSRQRTDITEVLEQQQYWSRFTSARARRHYGVSMQQPSEPAVESPSPASVVPLAQNTPSSKRCARSSGYSRNWATRSPEGYGRRNRLLQFRARNFPPTIRARHAGYASHRGTAVEAAARAPAAASRTPLRCRFARWRGSTADSYRDSRDGAS